MHPVYGDKCFTRPPIHAWCKKFASGGESVGDKERPGRHVVATTDATIATSDEFIKSNRRVSIWTLFVTLVFHKIQCTDRHTHSPLLQELHWLSVPERIKYRLVFCCRHDMAPDYLARDLQWAANTESRQRLRLSSSQQLIIPRTRLFTVGDRAFGAAAAHIWNSLPSTVNTAETLNSFKKHFKTHLFHCSFPSL